MSKKVLIITGSPREKYTVQLANGFAEGAKSKGHEVVTFNVAKKKVNNCIACDKCWSSSKPCVFNNDAFNELYEHIDSSDIIVFATPLHWYTYSGQIKSAIDKLYSISPAISKKDLKHKSSILISCGADAETNIFDGLIFSYKKLCQHMEWNIDDIITVSDIDNVDLDKVTLSIESKGKEVK